ncbi:MAG TPA: HAD-IIA family hydrolase [Terrimesophilobacter sp.]|nr:HAD-IIA family hydrolase [Terrimesophilobacter sp.]
MTESTPLEGVDVLLADLDGVVFKGTTAIPFAVESLTLAAQTARVGYVTNNASRTPASVAQQLRELGLDVADDEVVTSPQAAVRLLAELIPAGSLVLAVGGEGLRVELANAGFAVTDSARDEPVAVIQGYAPEVGWRHLAEAAFALQGEGADRPWVATNQDWTLPTDRGLAPGNGTLVSAVHTAIGRLPIIAGKPEVAIFTEAVARFGAQSPLFLGDRLDTDIVGANRAGIDSVLVLTGVDGPKQVLAADPASRPTYLLDHLGELHEPYPETLVEQDAAGDTLVSVGSSLVRVSNNRVTVESGGASQIDLLRAGCQAVWRSGKPIYALHVDATLYS